MESCIFEETYLHSKIFYILEFFFLNVHSWRIFGDTNYLTFKLDYDTDILQDNDSESTRA